MRHTLLLPLAAVGSPLLGCLDHGPATYPIADYEALVPIAVDFGRTREAVRFDVVTDPDRGGRIFRALFPANPAGGWTDLRLAAVDGIPPRAGSLELWCRGTAGGRVLVTLWEVESRSVAWPTQEMFGFEIELQETWTRHEIALGDFAPRWTIAGDGRLSPSKVVSVGIAQAEMESPTAVLVDDLAWRAGPAKLPELPASADWSRLNEALAQLQASPAVAAAEIPDAVRLQAPCVVKVFGALVDGSELTAAGVLLDEKTVACNKHFIGALRESTAKVEIGGGVRVQGRMLGGLEWRSAGGRSPLASDIAFLDLEMAVTGGQGCRFEAGDAVTHSGELVYSAFLQDDGVLRFEAGRAAAAEGVVLCALPAEQGQSGSPVFDRAGRLLGVIAGRYRGAAIAVPASKIFAQVATIRESLPGLDERNRRFFANWRSKQMY